MIETFFFLITLLVATAIALGLLTRLLNDNGGKSTKCAPPPFPSLPYISIPHLFTPAERSFLRILDQAIKPDYRVLGKVRAADVLGIQKGMSKKEWQMAFNRIQSKHFDFVICRASDSTILLLIELDDSSHSIKHRADRDNFLDMATKAAGVPLLRVPCQGRYSVSDLASLVSPHLP